MAEMPQNGPESNAAAISAPSDGGSLTEKELALNAYPAALLAREVIAAELCLQRGDREPTPLALATARTDAARLINALARQGLYVETAGSI